MKAGTHLTIFGRLHFRARAVRIYLAHLLPPRRARAPKRPKRHFMMPRHEKHASSARSAYKRVDTKSASPRSQQLFRRAPLARSHSMPFPLCYYIDAEFTTCRSRCYRFTGGQTRPEAESSPKFDDRRPRAPPLERHRPLKTSFTSYRRRGYRIWLTASTICRNTKSLSRTDYLISHDDFITKSSSTSPAESR